MMQGQQINVNDYIYYYNRNTTAYNRQVTSSIELLLRLINGVFDMINVNAINHRLYMTNMARALHVIEQNQTMLNNYMQHLRTSSQDDSDVPNTSNSSNSRNNENIRRTTDTSRNNSDGIEVGFSYTIPFITASDNPETLLQNIANYMNSNTATITSNILTQQQISISTEIVPYRENMADVRCPISLEDFTEGENVCRIKYCGHIFKQTDLMNWFTRNYRCPVCRYNLHQYREPAINTNTPIVNYPDSDTEPDYNTLSEARTNHIQPTTTVQTGMNTLISTILQELNNSSSNSNTRQ
jgi:hypothetical protein